MKSRHSTTRSGLRAVAEVLDVAAVASGHPSASPRGWGSLIVMMAVAMVGVVIWFGAFIVAGVIIAVFGLGQGPYAWLGTAVAFAGFFGGLAAAGIVMLRIIRRHRRLVTLSGFGDLDATSEDEPRSTPIFAAFARPPTMSDSRLRDIDARLAAPHPPTEPDAGAPVDRRPGPD